MRALFADRILSFPGRSHDITKQSATLLNLEGMDDKAKKLRFEWAHVTYFPSLLFHSMHQSLNATPPKAKET